MKNRKNVFLRILLVCAMMASLFVFPTAAAEATGAGIYDIQVHAMSAVLTPQTAGNVVVENVPDTSVNGAGPFDFYPGAVRFAFSCTPAASVTEVSVIVVKGEKDTFNLGTDAASMVYINQGTVGSDGVCTLAGNDAPFLQSLENGAYTVFANGTKAASFKYFLPEVAAGFTVSGQITSYLPGESAFVELKQGKDVKGTATIGANTSLSAPQTFTTTPVAAGTYDLVVTKPGHVSYTITGIKVEGNIDLTASTKEYSTIVLLPGDIDGSGTINVTDLNILWSSSNYGKGVGVAGVNKLTDLDGSGTVNVTDLNILWSSSNYGKSNIVIAY